MALNPALRKMITASAAKLRADEETPRGIIPFEPDKIEARDVMIACATEMISMAVTGPAVSARDLAERVVDEVLAIDAEWASA